MKIKLGRFSSTRAKQYVWVRLGDSGEYEKLRTPYGAGIYVGHSLPAETTIGDYPLNYRSGGVEILPDYRNLNYISLFWGDENGQWIRDLNNSEKGMFERGVKEGLA